VEHNARAHHPCAWLSAASSPISHPQAGSAQRNRAAKNRNPVLRLCLSGRMVECTAPGCLEFREIIVADSPCRPKRLGYEHLSNSWF
jgi:hypothetical protein